MAKKVEGLIKLQIPAGGATPAPPVGPALGQKGVNIMDFCKQFNAKTADQQAQTALPQTGESNDKAALAGLGLASILGGIGILGASKRKKKEN